MTTFSHWKNEIADMPAMVDGRWVDLETGVPFADYNQPRKPRARSTSPAPKLAEMREACERLVTGQRRAIERMTDKSGAEAFLAAATKAVEMGEALLSVKATKAQFEAHREANAAASRLSNLIK